MKLSQTMKKRLLPVIILVIAILLAQVIISNPPQANRRGPSKAPQMTVEAQQLTPQMYQVYLDSFGTVKPRTESVLVAQASGQINYISEQFRDGGFFERGDVLLKLDDRDHRADVNIARANLLDAKQNLAEEQARSEQAAKDWQRLGKAGQPSALVLRQPQLEAAKAKRLSAQAQFEKAQLALERTQIIAPYAGRVLSKKVDLGQVVSNNSPLADIYAIDRVEIRLPIKNQDLALIDLPEEFRGQTNSTQVGATVKLLSAVNDQSWSGQLVRTEGAIDEQSQQLYVVAQIEDPYAFAQDANPSRQGAIKIGQYVSANIAAKLLPNALVIPTQSIYQGSFVYIVDEGVLLRKEVELLWKNEHEAVIKSGLNTGELLVTTALGQVSSGTPVSVANKAGETNANRKGKGQGNRQKLNVEERLKRMPAERRQALMTEAKERGVSIEQLIKEKRKLRGLDGGKS